MATNKRKGGCPQNEIWEHYRQGNRDSEGHASGTCNFCGKTYSRGDMFTLQALDATFFRNNARASAKFCELLNTMNIKGGVIVPYCKTRWTTAYKSIDDVLRVKVILENVTKPLNRGIWMRIVKYAGETAQKLGMDLAKARILCSHLLKYKNKESLFDQPYTEGIDNPIKWWSTEWPEFEEDDDEIAPEGDQELSNLKILNGLENFGFLEEEENEKTNGDVDGNNQNGNEVAGRGILNYNVDNLAKEFE
ncbi:unnamed protein product [Rhizophagus irregularis]|nr:unnamed protein product [Rhizophagus irregularis]